MVNDGRLSVDGKASISREDITPGAGFKWKTDWNFEVKDGVTDDKGWMYALDFQWKFVPNNRLTDSVRKRSVVYLLLSCHITLYA
jgi:hypothetical protein